MPTAYNTRTGASLTASSQCSARQAVPAGVSVEQHVLGRVDAIQGRPLDPRRPGLINNTRVSECQTLAWHPLLPLLAIGWKDGEQLAATC